MRSRLDEVFDTVVLIRDDAHCIIAGAATDELGRWTWWARSTGGRRVVAESREEAVQMARGAAGGGDE